MKERTAAEPTRRRARPGRGWGLRALIPALLAGASALSGQSSGIGLTNLSTRGVAAGGSSMMIGGFVIGGGAAKTVLVRAIGQGLGGYGVAGFLANPSLTLLDAHGTVLASNSQWLAADAGVFASVGAFALAPGSDDADVVATLPPGAYSAEISGPGAGGVALLEVYDAGGAGQLVNLSTRLGVGSGADVAIAGFTIAAGEAPRKLLVRGIGPGLAPYGLSGLLADPRIDLMDAGQRLLAGAAGNGADPLLAAASAQAGAFTAAAGDAAVILTLGPGAYTAEVSSGGGLSSGLAMVEVYDITATSATPVAVGASPVLYLAKLLPGPASSGSLASGFASVQYDPNSGTATVSAQFSNLSSPETAAHLMLGTPGAGGIALLALPAGSVSGQSWALAPSGTASSAAIRAALQNGQVYLEVDTAGYPTGELTGAFGQSAGSASFTPPPVPPALAAGALTSPGAADAARFLTQASFGPTQAAVASLQARGIGGWIADQMALPASSHLAATRADSAAFPTPQAGLPGDETYTAITWANRLAAWWKISLTGPDQLRQRVAFALSEIFVVSDQSTTLRPQAEALAHYYDLLAADAFGNFRQLLQDVSLSPVMGVYLTDLQNQPASTSSGASPDENYAREVQQLFTVGLVQLNPDGTVLLDASGLPIPTYDQATVSQTAKVFTGWSFANLGGNYYGYPPDTRPAGASDGSGWLNPMAAYPAYHDVTAKSVISLQQLPLDQAAPTVLPAGQGAEQDLAAELDALFRHPNTGPFFCRQLIQHLVTSNPSPGYVYRVAQVFTNDGTGVRGNLGAVVQAILTDYEARSPAAAAQSGHGKIKEPLLRLTGFFRALNAAAPNGRFLDSYYNDPRSGYAPGSLLALPEFFLGQGALEAPSVFNFFPPDYVAGGPLAAAGLVAPEMAITDATFTMNFANELSYYLFRDVAALPAPPAGASPFLALDTSALTPLAGDPGALLDSLNLLFCGDAMTAGTRAQILASLAALSPNTSAAEFAASAVFLTATSPDAARQK